MVQTSLSSYLHSILWVSAQLFGTGAIRMVKALHIDALSFGSETADLDTLVDITKRMDCESTQIVLRTYINEGMSYGSAFRKI